MVFHEQVIEIIARFAGVSYAEADEKRRALGDVEGMAETEAWFFPRALARGYDLRAGRADLEGPRGVRVVRLLQGPRRGVRPADLPVGVAQGPLAGALPGRGAHPRPGHVPQAADPRRRPPVRDRRARPRRQRLRERPTSWSALGRPTPPPRSGSRCAEVKGISAAEVAAHRHAPAAVTGAAPGRSGRPYVSLTDFWHRARVSRPVARAAGAGRRVRRALRHRGGADEVRRRGRITRRDLLLQVAELDRHARALDRAARGRGRGPPRRPSAAPCVPTPRPQQHRPAAATGRRPSGTRWPSRASGRGPPRSRRRPGRPRPVDSVQLTLDLGDEPGDGEAGHRAARDDHRGADARRAGDPRPRRQPARRRLLRRVPRRARRRPAAATCSRRRSKAELLVAGVKVATQTPPIRSGRRVVFLTLDDATGPVDATFFEDAQGPYAATVFHSWLLVVRGELRRTGRRGVSLRATGAWELPGAARALAARRAAADAALGRGARRARPRCRSEQGRRRRARRAPGAGALQRLPDVALRRHQAGRRGHQARVARKLVAPQPREPRMTRGRPHAPVPTAARVAAMSSPASAASAARTGVVWDAACRGVLGRARATVPTSRRPGVARHRRRHRRVRRPARRAGPPRHRRRPQPRRPRRPRPARPTRPASPTGSPAAGRPGRPAGPRRGRQRRRGAVPRRARGGRRPRGRAGHDRRGAPPRRAPSACWSPSGTPPSSPGRWPVTSSQALALLDRPPPRLGGAAAAGSPPTRSPRCWPTPASPRRGARASGSSPTWCPARLLDLEPGATAALVELEQAVADRPEYLPLATQLHAARHPPLTVAGRPTREPPGTSR